VVDGGVGELGIERLLHALADPRVPLAGDVDDDLGVVVAFEVPLQHVADELDPLALQRAVTTES